MTKKLSLNLTIQKYAKQRIVEVTSADRLKCIIYSCFVNMCMPRRHAIIINEQKMVIGDNLVRWMKLYGGVLENTQLFLYSLLQHGSRVFD